MKRASGVLMHISSLPGSYGCGSLGKSAYDFVDLLKDCGFSYWQMLPVEFATNVILPINHRRPLREIRFCRP